MSTADFARTSAEAVATEVQRERRRILDVVQAVAEQAECDCQREPLNRILEIFGREPVTERWQP